MYSSKRHLPLYKQIVYDIKLTIRKKKTHIYMSAYVQISPMRCQGCFLLVVALNTSC